MIYNSDELELHFDATWTHPEPDVGWVGGWEIFVTEIRRFNNEGEIIEFITRSSEIKELVTPFIYSRMQEIAKGKQ